MTVVDGRTQALVGPGLATPLQVKQVHSEQDDDQLQKLEGTIKATLEQLPLLILTKLPQEWVYFHMQQVGLHLIIGVARGGYGSLGDLPYHHSLLYHFLLKLYILEILL